MSAKAIGPMRMGYIAFQPEARLLKWRDRRNRPKAEWWPAWIARSMMKRYV